MVESSELYNRYNTDDIFNRSVITGLLNLMNNAIKYEQIWENNIVESVSVPCAFELVNSDNERFLQDNYTFFGRACFGDKKIDGKFDMLPRTILKYTGCSIDSANITNRFIKGNYLKNENGKLTSYTAFLYSIPISMNFECETRFDSIDSGFKIEQALRDTFYKNKTYNVLYKGLKIGCRVGFPETTSVEKVINFSFDAERAHLLKYSLVVECYQPCFDNSVEIDSGKRIEYIGIDYSHYNTGLTPLDRKINLHFTNPTNGITIPSGSSFEVTWDGSSNVSDLCTVSLSYIDENNKEHQIATPLYNHKYYVWNIPETFTGYKQPDMIYLSIDDNNITVKPIIKILPDSNNKFTENSFIIINPGLFTGVPSMIPFLLEYIDDNGNNIMSDYNNPYYFKISNRKVESVIVPEIPFEYTKTVKSKNISLKLTYPIDNKFFTKVDNILII